MGRRKGFTQAEMVALTGASPSVVAYLQSAPGDIETRTSAFLKVASAARAELAAIAMTRALASAKGEPQAEQVPVLEAVSRERDALAGDKAALEGEVERLNRQVERAIARPAMAAYGD